MLHQSDEKGKVEIAVLKNDDCFRIITFNTTSINDSQNLLEHSSNINALTNAELKTQYRDKLLSSEINQKGTIGVGMELIRLRSTNKIFISIDESEGERIVIIDVKIDN